MSIVDDVVEMVRTHTVVRVDPALATLVPRFMENRRLDLVALKGALADGDFNTIQSIGHAIKGTGGGYGFHAISALGKELEDCGKNQDGVGATQWVEALDGYLAQVEVLYEAAETT